MIRVAISGCSGRMGRELITACENNPLLVATVGSEKPGSPWIGKQLSALGASATKAVIVDDLSQVSAEFDVLIDFTRPQVTLTQLDHCVAQNKMMIIGTTGFDDAQLTHIVSASKSIPIVMSANMSIGVNLCLSLLQHAARALGDDYDIEIVETHHRHKVDAPSGTAIAMGEAIADVLGCKLSERAVYERHGITGERKAGTIGFQAIRAGDIVGDHTVMFAGDGERIEISHKASSRQTYAGGAIKATCWLNGQAAGLYSMQDVLGISAEA